MKNVTIAGSGFVGRAWAITYARAGCNVTLWDKEKDAPARAMEFIAGVLPELETNGLLNGRSLNEVLDSLKIEEDFGTAVSKANYVQENTPEQLDIKKTVFAELDAAAPDNAILASSTSAILPSAFTEDLAGRHRCVVVHPINPPYLVPAAEVVPAPWTATETVEQCREFLIACGQAPLVMKRELDGFIMNRMQGALLEEAFRLVADGYATVDDIDIGIRDGLALRWSFMGPFETIDLNAPAGVREYAERYQGIYENIFKQVQRRVDWAGPVMDTIEKQRRLHLPKEKLEQRQAWRDKRLMALTAHKRIISGQLGD